jgi:hypothetical protein
MTERKTTGRLILSCKGQMAVELAVALPVILIMLGVLVNTMCYLNVCARFDRLAAEAVRIEAVSPAYGDYGSQSRADKVAALLRRKFADKAGTVRIEVFVQRGPRPEAGGLSIPLAPQPETYVCVLHYSPAGLGVNFFGMDLLSLEHRRFYLIDPFRPGVLL